MDFDRTPVFDYPTASTRAFVLTPNYKYCVTAIRNCTYEVLNKIFYSVIHNDSNEYPLSQMQNHNFTVRLRNNSCPEI